VKLVIEIELENDAFFPEPEYECASLLHDLANLMVPGKIDWLTTGNYYFADENGNRCGVMGVKNFEGEWIDGEYSDNETYQKFQSR